MQAINHTTLVTSLMNQENVPVKKGAKSLIGLFLLTMSLLLSSCGSKEDDRQKRKDIDPIEIKPEVIFDVADSKPIQFYVRSRGVVEAVNSFPLNPRISGFIAKHSIRDGQKIAKADTLLKFDDREWKLRVQESYHNLLQTKRAYEISLVGRDSSRTTQEEKQLLEINSGYANAKVQYNRNVLELEYAQIIAPFNGEIATEFNLVNGSFLGAGRELGTLINTELMQIRFDVLESEISAFKEGMLVEISTPDRTSLNGKVVAISPSVDQRTKTAQVLVQVANERNLLKVGMTVEGKIITEEQLAKCRIPRDALLERDGKSLVFKYHGDTTEAEWIYVTPIAMNSEWVLIDHPKIAAGDTLAIDQHFALSHKQKVQARFN